MSMREAQQFEARIYALVRDIPRGRVATYGQLAFLAGRPKGARAAGRALRFAPPGLACHRVVNSSGRLVPGWDEQRDLLLAEGVLCKPNGCVDLKLYRMRNA